MTEIDEFEKDFEELISLLKKIKTMSNNGQLHQIDVDFVDECTILLENYQLIKSTLNQDLITVVGNPIFEMVKEFILTLKQELSNVYQTNIGNAVIDELHELDEMLNKPNLSVENIDAILDKRITLMEKLKQTEL